MKAYIGPIPEGEEPREYMIELDYSDVYEARTTLALVIAPVIRRYREESSGWPVSVSEDAPEGLEDREAWHWVLEEIEWTFTQLGRDWEQDFFHEGLIEGRKQFPRKDQTIDAGYDFSVDEAGIDRCRERISKGLKLFAKYFQSLWD